MLCARDILDSALKFGINPSLEPIRRICTLLGNPEERFSSIQVAGTNGKSSTSRYLAALLTKAGYKVGLYTSPELVSLTERIEVDGEPITPEEFETAILKVYKTAEHDGLTLTEFEILTAAAFWYFASREVDYAVLEVGLGGRWDATSVVHPELAVLTGVALDHTAILGNSLVEIAGEKAAIIKEGTLAVAAPTDPEVKEVFSSYACKQGQDLIEVPPVEQHAHNYQEQNKLTALIAAGALLTKKGAGDLGLPRFTQAAVTGSTQGPSLQELLDWIEDTPLLRQALNDVVIPGRLEILHEAPLLIIDAAHNPASAATLAQVLPEVVPPSLEPVLLLGVLDDKDARGIVEALASHFARIVVTQTASPRAIPSSDLAKLVQEISGVEPLVYKTPADALATLLKQEHPIVATGSITLAGEVKQAFLTKD